MPSQLRELCKMLGSVDYDRVFKLTSDSVRNTTEIILAYYRRPQDLGKFHGRAALIGPGIDLDFRDDK